MVKLNIAGSTLVGLPKNMVFLDEKGKGHIYPSLTAKKHIATHYGIPSIELNAKKGYNVGIVGKSTYTDSSNKNIVNTVKKARAKTEKAQKKIKEGVQEIQQAQQSVEIAVKKRGRPKLSQEQKAANKQMRKDKKMAEKAQIKEDKKIKAVEKETAKLEKQMAIEQKRIAKKMAKMEKKKSQ
jgi:hypothetical protein